ncbi:DinB family protein [Paenibacillus bovis]|uniref:Damage-inducible protein DinB n=1 Tax=Paenibacillus bovis TaxID=1616788 RepID=A0A172ZHA7_9BACL|nr:DinB family protein [Paenibacillus bovis]ANF96667.1 damage-inducible protein DinB [Paenibacillus bovis]
MTNHPVEMFNYHIWATRTILDRIAELPPTVLNQEVNSSFPTIAHALSHMYAVDEMWYRVMTGANMAQALQDCMSFATQVMADIGTYKEVLHQLSEQYHACLQEQTDLEQRILVDNPYAGIREVSLSEILLHVANHGTYHRGNISTMLRQLGHASTMTDYVLYWYTNQPHIPSA